MIKTCFTTDWKVVKVDTEDVVSFSPQGRHDGLAVLRLTFSSARPPVSVYTTVERLFDNKGNNDLTVEPLV
jgi:hypothetical protein